MRRLLLALLLLPALALADSSFQSADEWTTAKTFRYGSGRFRMAWDNDIRVYSVLLSDTTGLTIPADSSRAFVTETGDSCTAYWWKNLEPGYYRYIECTDDDTTFANLPERFGFRFAPDSSVSAAALQLDTAGRFVPPGPMAPDSGDAALNINWIRPRGNGDVAFDSSGVDVFGRIDAADGLYVSGGEVRVDGDRQVKLYGSVYAGDSSADTLYVGGVVACSLDVTLGADATSSVITIGSDLSDQTIVNSTVACSSAVWFAMEPEVGEDDTLSTRAYARSVGGGGGTGEGALFYSTDLLNANNLLNAVSPTWGAAAISSGTATGDQYAISGDHPGAWQLLSATGANSGYYVMIAGTLLRLAGGENSDVIFLQRATTLATSRYITRLGFHDSVTAALPTDGVYLQIGVTGDPANADSLLVKGRTANNGTRDSTATGYAISADTWYRAKTWLNSDASKAYFQLRAENGTVLWYDSLAAQIPTGAGRNTGHGVVATNSGAGAAAMLSLDYLALWWDRTLAR